MQPLSSLMQHLSMNISQLYTFHISHYVHVSVECIHFYRGANIPILATERLKKLHQFILGRPTYRLVQNSGYSVHACIF